MELALRLGRRGWGRTWPNPAVGCVIVGAGRVLGRGWTADGGRPHAETRALAQAGAGARGATAYVTLEPCAHTGRTPPCADALAAAGIARVVTALEDPDPRTAGRGHARLRAAGVAVETGCLAGRARQDHAGFLLRITAGRPLVTLKLAISLDGRIATAAGESRWITGPDSRRRVHLMRASHDAVMIGAGTARTDDPMLTVRGLGIARQPVRVVCDTHLALRPDSRLGRSIADAPLWLVHGPAAAPERRSAWTAAGARLIAAETDGTGRLAMPAVLAALGQSGLTRVFCEGGGQLAASLLKAGLADRLAVFSAGLVLGGDGVPAVAEMALGRLADAPRYRLAAVTTTGADVLSEWHRDEPGGE